MLLNFIHLSPALNNLFDAFLRRNTKDYYVPGKYVYVKFACAIDPRSYYGPEDNIYIIKEIGHGRYGNELVLVKDLTQPDGCEVRFKLNIDRLRMTTRSHAYDNLICLFKKIHEKSRFS